MRTLILLLTFALSGFSAFPNGYCCYKALTVDHTKVSVSDQTNFPVLVAFTDASLKTTANGGRVSNSSGFDITFWRKSVV